MFKHLEGILLRPKLDAVSRRNARGAFIKVMGHQVHYELTGEPGDPLVVLVTGLSTPLFGWDFMAEALRGAGYRVLSYDLFGRGYSDRPTIPDYDPEFFVSQLKGVLANLGITENFTLVGWSMGGIITTRYALEHSDRVDSMVLIAPAGLIGEISGIGRWLSLPAVGEALAGLMGRRSLLSGASELFVNPAKMADYEQKYRVQMNYRGFARAILSSVRHMPLRDFRESYAALGRGPCPVLLIWGERDDVCPYANHREFLELVPQARCKTIANSGHAVLIEHHELVNPELISFLQESNHSEPEAP